MRAQDYRRVLKTGVDVWKNYLLSIEVMKDSLINPNTLNSLIELLKVLPTRDHEYYDLGDLLSILTQIFSSSSRMIASSQGDQSIANFEELLIRLMDALKYHLMPYLEETGISGLDPNETDLSPKSYLLHKYIELLSILI